jgi:hypothetical protein
MQQQELLGNEQPVSVGRLSQPHFDEEATLLSARPVVPLQALKSKTRGKHRLLFAGAIALSILVGAVGATLIYSKRSQEPEQNAQRDRQSDSGDNLASAQPATEETSEPAPAADSTDEGVSEEFIEVPEPELEQPSIKRITKSARQKRAVAARGTVKLLAVSEKPFAQNSPPETEPQQLPGEETREERRPRRVADGETEMDRDHASEDLFRIREIFEGPRRRRNRNQSAYPF